MLSRFTRWCIAAAKPKMMIGSIMAHAIHGQWRFAAKIHVPGIAKSATTSSAFHSFGSGGGVEPSNLTLELRNDFADHLERVVDIVERCSVAEAQVAGAGWSERRAAAACNAAF